MERLTELKYYITKLDAKIENMQKRIDKMAFDDKAEVGIKFLASTVSYLKELREYKQLEEQGLILKLPCKVGDKVHVLNKIKREIFPSRVEHIEYVVNDNLDFPLTKIKGEGFCVFFDDFGKIVFLTKEEAEQKLKEMERAWYDDWWSNITRKRNSKKK